MSLILQRSFLQIFYSKSVSLLYNLAKPTLPHQIVGPNLMLPAMLTLWGVVTTCQGPSEGRCLAVTDSVLQVLLKHTADFLLAASSSDCSRVSRLFLTYPVLTKSSGGVFPGLVLYLSFFYPRLRLQTRFVSRPCPCTKPSPTNRITTFFSAASISGAFGGIMAYGIINLNGKAGHSGWQWIFIIEVVFSP